MSNTIFTKNIKTKSEFYEFANIWYQRSHKLKEIWQNIRETDERKEKAFILWYVMYSRMMELVNIAIQLSQPKIKL